MSGFERGPGRSLAEHVDQVIEAAFTDQRLVGAVVLVAHRGRWLYRRAAGLALWGLTFGGAATLLQTASADAAGEGADLAQSMIVVAWNLAIAGGGALGGMVLQRWGSEMLPWTLLPLIGLAGVLAWGNAAHAFRVGPRDFRRASSERRKAAQ